MAEPTLAATRLAGSADAPALLVVGPSLGTSVEVLWEAAANQLSDRFEVIGWDLPGHGASVPAAEPFTVADLAAAVRRIGGEVASGRPAAYAGVSLGGAVALELALEPGPFSAVACLASAAKIGDAATWHDRAELVRRAGTPVMVAGSSERWFAPGFLDRDPGTANRLLLSLSDSDRESYALACDALAVFDVRGRLSDARVPVLVGPGELDVVVSPQLATETTADLMPAATVHVFTGCGHLPPAEDPGAVAEVLRATFATGGEAMTDTYDEGMRVRREVLGEAHVESAERRKTRFTQDFQELITHYAWGSVWTRPGLDRRTRSVAVLTATIALGHWEEFAMHVRAARTNGLSVDEIGEVILQSAIYCGVPAANHGFAVAQQVLDSLESPDQ